MPIFLLFLIGLPLVELYLLIRVSGVIGVLPTIGLAVLTAVLGATLVRHQGFGVLQRVQTALARGELPAHDLLDGVLLLIAGFFLLLPGVVTDCLGLMLVLPPLRRWLIRLVLARLPRPSAPVTAASSQTPSVIEGEWRQVD